jgi:hypothetical protein
VIGANSGRQAEFLGWTALTWGAVGATIGTMLGALFGAALFTADILSQRGGPHEGALAQVDDHARPEK